MTVKRTVASPFLISSLPLITTELERYLPERIPPAYYNYVYTPEGVGRDWRVLSPGV